MRTTIKVSGMSCVNCVRHVTEALEGLAGVKDVKIDLPTGEVSFEKADSVSIDDITVTIQGAGYKVVN